MMKIVEKKWFICMVNTMLKSDNVHVYQARTNNLHITNEEFWKLLKLQNIIAIV